MRSYDIFISYSEQDEKWVRTWLRPHLEQVGLRIISFRDFDPGAPRPNEIERALQTSRKTLLILTPAYLESNWATLEITMLQTLDPSNRERRLLPLIKEQCDLPLNIRHLINVDFTQADQWEKELRRVIVLLTNPFRSLQAFTEQDTDLFNSLGRNAEISDIYRALIHPNFQAVIVHGDPGVGKTSLIQAGVLPRFTNDQSELIPVHFRFKGRNLAYLDAELTKEVRAKLTQHLPGARGDFPNLSVRLTKEKNKNLLLVFDQFEWIYQQDSKLSQRFLDRLASWARGTKFKFLIGIRQEYFFQVLYGTISSNFTKLFPDLDALYPLPPLQYFGKEEAAKVIAESTREVFPIETARKLVDIICGNASQPYTPYIQIVCDELWKSLVFSKNLSKVSPDDWNEEQVRKIMGEYLDRNIEKIEPKFRGLASAILRHIVKSQPGKILPNPMPEKAIAHLVAIEEEEEVIVHNIIEQLYTYMLVDFVYSNGNRVVRIAHDFLAEIIVEKYSKQINNALEATDNLIRTLRAISRTATSKGGDGESVVLDLIQTFLNQQHQVYVESLQAKERMVFLDSLTLQFQLLQSVLKDLLTPSSGGVVDAKGACLVVDCLYQILLLLGKYDPHAYGKAKQLGREFVNLIQLHDMLSEETKEKLIKAYSDDHVHKWQSLCEGEEPDGEDAQILRNILKSAQQRRDHTIMDLRVSLGLTSRLPLWRLLYKLWWDEATRDPSPDQIQKAPLTGLFSDRWVLAPSHSYLYKYGATESYRTYQGVMVHIPAGEHAMRNQRAARNLLIRTVAVERGLRGTAPGWHEADDKYLINTYSDVEFKSLLHAIAQDYAVMLNKDRKMWIVLEAQEYPVKDMVRICADVATELEERGETFGESIFTDVGAEIANRKDLTRGLAALADVPQPPYWVLASTAKKRWDHIWRTGMEQRNVVRWLPEDEDWEKLAPAERKEEWLSRLRKAVEAVGGRAMVKPIITEFLKGATPVERPADLDLAWERIQGQVGFPQVVVEKLIPNIRKELLVIVVRRPDGSYVDVPPVWYQCIRDFKWQADLDHKSVPVAMDYAWVSRELRPDDSEEVRKNLDQDRLIFEKARAFSQTLAEKLWAEVEHDPRYKVHNRFLECEWFVLDNEELMLNEIKPTQLDKGIISNMAFTHSDSELLVRNLFGFPLPDVVRRTRPEETIVCGAVLTKNDHDVEMITKGRNLIGYDGIDEALQKGADVFLYPDKMQSRPYIGRRMGILTASAANLKDAQAILQAARAALIPRYEMG